MNSSCCFSSPWCDYFNRFLNEFDDIDSKVMVQTSFQANKCNRSHAVRAGGRSAQVRVPYWWCLCLTHSDVVESFGGLTSQQKAEISHHVRGVSRPSPYLSVFLSLISSPSHLLPSSPQLLSLLLLFLLTLIAAIRAGSGAAGAAGAGSTRVWVGFDPVPLPGHRREY